MFFRLKRQAYQNLIASLQVQVFSVWSPLRTLAASCREWAANGQAGCERHWISCWLNENDQFLSTTNINMLYFVSSRKRNVFSGMQLQKIIIFTVLFSFGTFTESNRLLMTKNANKNQIKQVDTPISSSTTIVFNVIKARPLYLFKLWVMSQTATEKSTIIYVWFLFFLYYYYFYSSIPLFNWVSILWINYQLFIGQNTVRTLMFSARYPAKRVKLVIENQFSNIQFVGIFIGK